MRLSILVVLALPAILLALGCDTRYDSSGGGPATPTPDDQAEPTGQTPPSDPSSSEAFPSAPGYTEQADSADYEDTERGDTSSEPTAGEPSFFGQPVQAEQSPASQQPTPARQQPPPSQQRPVSQQPSISLSGGVALPQSLPTGTAMGFSVDYQFTSGQPGSFQYGWVIVPTKGEPVVQKMQLNREGTLQGFVIQFRPEHGPFKTYVVDYRGTKLSRELSLR